MISEETTKETSEKRHHKPAHTADYPCNSISSILIILLVLFQKMGYQGIYIAQKWGFDLWLLYQCVQWRWIVHRSLFMLPRVATFFQNFGPKRNLALFFIKSLMYVYEYAPLWGLSLKLG
jgi:hypothetical protein